MKVYLFAMLVTLGLSISSKLTQLLQMKPLWTPSSAAWDIGIQIALIAWTVALLWK